MRSSASETELVSGYQIPDVFTYGPHIPLSQDEKLTSTRKALADIYNKNEEIFDPIKKEAGVYMPIGQDDSQTIILDIARKSMVMLQVFRNSPEYKNYQDNYESKGFKSEKLFKKLIIAGDTFLKRLLPSLAKKDKDAYEKFKKSWHQNLYGRACYQIQNTLFEKQIDYFSHAAFAERVKPELKEDAKKYAFFCRIQPRFAGENLSNIYEADGKIYLDVYEFNFRYLLAQADGEILAEHIPGTVKHRYIYKDSKGWKLVETHYSNFLIKELCECDEKLDFNKDKMNAAILAEQGFPYKRYRSEIFKEISKILDNVEDKHRAFLFELINAVNAFAYESNEAHYLEMMRLQRFLNTETNLFKKIKEWTNDYLEQVYVASSDLNLISPRTKKGHSSNSSGNSSNSSNSNNNSSSSSSNDSHSGSDNEADISDINSDTDDMYPAGEEKQEKIYHESIPENTQIMVENNGDSSNNTTSSSDDEAEEYTIEEEKDPEPTTEISHVTVEVLLAFKDEVQDDPGLLEIWLNCILTFGLNACFYPDGNLKEVEFAKINEGKAFPSIESVDSQTKKEVLETYINEKIIDVKNPLSRIMIAEWLQKTFQEMSDIDKDYIISVDNKLSRIVWDDINLKNERFKANIEENISRRIEYRYQYNLQHLNTNPQVASAGMKILEKVKDAGRKDHFTPRFLEAIDDLLNRGENPSLEIILKACIRTSEFFLSSPEYKKSKNTADAIQDFIDIYFSDFRALKAKKWIEILFNDFLNYMASKEKSPTSLFTMKEDSEAKGKIDGILLDFCQLEGKTYLDVFQFNFPEQNAGKTISPETASWHFVYQNEKDSFELENRFFKHESTKQLCLSTNKQVLSSEKMTLRPEEKIDDLFNHFRHQILYQLNHLLKDSEENSKDHQKEVGEYKESILKLINAVNLFINQPCQQYYELLIGLKDELGISIPVFVKKERIDKIIKPLEDLIKLYETQNQLKIDLTSGTEAQPDERIRKDKGKGKEKKNTSSGEYSSDGSESEEEERLTRSVSDNIEEAQESGENIPRLIKSPSPNIKLLLDAFNYKKTLNTIFFKNEKQLNIMLNAVLAAALNELFYENGNEKQLLKGMLAAENIYIDKLPSEKERESTKQLILKQYLNLIIEKIKDEIKTKEKDKKILKKLTDEIEQIANNLMDEIEINRNYIVKINNELLINADEINNIPLKNHISEQLFERAKNRFKYNLLLHTKSEKSGADGQAFLDEVTSLGEKDKSRHAKLTSLLHATNDIIHAPNALNVKTCEKEIKDCANYPWATKGLRDLALIFLAGLLVLTPLAPLSPLIAYYPTISLFKGANARRKADAEPMTEKGNTFLKSMAPS